MTEEVETTEAVAPPAKKKSKPPVGNRGNMRRCSSCGKACSLEMSEDFDVNPDLQAGEEDADKPTEIGISFDCEIMMQSACCSDDVASAQVEASGDVTIEHGPDCVLEDRDYSAAADCTPVEERTGGRYGKTTRGVEAVITVTCTVCSATEDVTLTATEAASAFENIN